MKIFVITVCESDFDYTNTWVLGVLSSGQFDRFIQLIKDGLSNHQKIIFNQDHFLFEKLERDFDKVTNALNCKDNKTWDLYFYSYFKSDESKKTFKETDGFAIECHWLGAKP